MIWSFLYKQLTLVAFCLKFVIVQIFLEQSIFFFFFFVVIVAIFCFLSKTTVDIFVIQFHSIDVSAVTKWILCIKRTSIVTIVKSFYVA